MISEKSSKLKEIGEGLTAGAPVDHETAEISAVLGFVPDDLRTEIENIIFNS